jgi:hypothetical protein
MHAEFYLENQKRRAVLSGSLVTTAWHVLVLLVEETISRCGGKL